MKIFKKDNYRVPIKAWLTDIEESAQKQIDNVASLPFVFHHIAFMPDCHMGYGVPIGSVVATQNVISPAMVGVDIGCGMLAFKTDLTEIDTETLKKIMGDIRKEVPVGFNWHDKAQIDEYTLIEKLESAGEVVKRQITKATKQLGTLGGGNHFIEIQKGSDGYIWVMIHSGSRNLGKQVADYYSQRAVELNQKYFSIVPKEYQLAFLPMNSPEGKQYYDEMKACLKFAQLNRDYMANRIYKILREHTGCMQPDESINIHHNYATFENHFSKNVIVHRKGATSAREGQLGIIPGSQGTCSYIVQGKGNPESFNSCSHGAGRRMGRREAQRTLNLEEEIKKMEDKGIIHGLRTAKDLDEAASAYKDIDVVMENQKDLVEILTKLTPLAVIKG